MGYYQIPYETERTCLDSYSTLWVLCGSPLFVEFAMFRAFTRPKKLRYKPKQVRPLDLPYHQNNTVTWNNNCNLISNHILNATIKYQR